jgi:hypothetical protein
MISAFLIGVFDPQGAALSSFSHKYGWVDKKLSHPCRKVLLCSHIIYFTKWTNNDVKCCATQKHVHYCLLDGICYPALHIYWRYKLSTWQERKCNTILLKFVYFWSEIDIFMSLRNFFDQIRWPKHAIKIMIYSSSDCDSRSSKYLHI